MDLNAPIMVHVSIYVRQLGVSLKLIQMQKSSGATEDNINHSFKDIFVSALCDFVCLMLRLVQLYCKIILVFASLIMSNTPVQLYCKIIFVFSLLI